MAYTHPGLHRVGPANSDVPTLWTYKTNDTVAVVRVEDYFLAASDDLTVGDLIMAYCDADGTPAFQLFVVNSVSSTAVDVTDGTAIDMTDTD